MGQIWRKCSNGKYLRWPQRWCSKMLCKMIHTVAKCHTAASRVSLWECCKSIIHKHLGKEKNIFGFGTGSALYRGRKKEREWWKGRWFQVVITSIVKFGRISGQCGTTVNIVVRCGRMVVIRWISCPLKSFPKGKRLASFQLWSRTNRPPVWGLRQWIVLVDLAERKREQKWKTGFVTICLANIPRT